MRNVLFLIGILIAGPASAGTMTLSPSDITEWKAVYGRVEARDMVPARARLGGIVVELTVSEGDLVKTGEKIATVRDDKIAFQIAALDAQIRSVRSQLQTAQAELERGAALVAKGIITPQRIDQLRTAVDVSTNQTASLEAQRAVLVQQNAEGDVIAATSGRVLTVPVTRGAVILAGETVANIGGGGFFLRLAIPERHAASLVTGDTIRINANGQQSTGKLAKIYPQIENGRVIADVEVDKLNTDFVNARVLVELPIGQRSALLVPRDAVQTRSGIDFVRVSGAGGDIERAIVIGETIERDNTTFVEVLTGLSAGDSVSLP